jgi:hypothetical protein
MVSLTMLLWRGLLLLMPPLMTQFLAAAHLIAGVAGASQREM